MLAGPPADPFLEGVGEDEGVLVADGIRDGLHFERRGGEKFGGFAHPQPGDVMHGTATE